MEVPIKFEVNNRGIDYDVLDGDKRIHLLQCYDYGGKGYTISFCLTPEMYELAEKQSEQTKEKTRRVFKTAVECAIDNYEFSGIFSIYLDDKGVFDVGRSFQDL